MKNKICLDKIVMLVVFGICSLWADSQSGGNFTVNATITEPGDLTVEGNTHVNGSFDLGTTAASQSAILFNYTENGTAHTLGIMATQPNTGFLWQDNGAGTPRSKMKLDADNVLSLFDSSGVAKLVFNPNTGAVTLAGTGSGIVLSDGTVLSNAASLRSTALYDSSGVSRMNFDTNGQLSVKGTGTTSGILAQFSDSTNAPQATLSNDGSLAIGTTGSPSGNARLTLKGKSVHNWATFEMYDSEGNQTFMFSDGGFFYQKKGAFFQSNQYNSRTFTLDSGQGYLDANDVMFLNRWTTANTFINYGGGRTGVGTNSVSSARMQIVNNPSNGVAADAVLRLVQRADQTGNIFASSLF